METIQTTARPTLEVIREVFGDVLNRRDADALIPYWAEDIVEEFPMVVLRGRKAVRDHFAAMFAAIPDFRISPISMAENGDTVFVRWHATGTFSGSPWLGIESTGSALDLQGIDCITMRDGLVAHNHVAYDQLSFARQIGLLPPEGSTMDRALMGAFNARMRLKKRLARR